MSPFMRFDEGVVTYQLSVEGRSKLMSEEKERNQINGESRDGNYR